MQILIHRVWGRAWEAESNKIPGDTHAAGPQATLCIVRAVLLTDSTPLHMLAPCRRLRWGLLAICLYPKEFNFFSVFRAGELSAIPF